MPKCADNLYNILIGDVLQLYVWCVNHMKEFILKTVEYFAIRYTVCILGHTPCVRPALSSHFTMLYMYLSVFILYSFSITINIITLFFAAWLLYEPLPFCAMQTLTHFTVTWLYSFFFLKKNMLKCDRNYKGRQRDRVYYYYYYQLTKCTQLIDISYMVYVSVRAYLCISNGWQPWSQRNGHFFIGDFFSSNTKIYLCILCVNTYSHSSCRFFFSILHFVHTMAPYNGWNWDKRQNALYVHSIPI